MDRIASKTAWNISIRCRLPTPASTACVGCPILQPASSTASPSSEHTMQALANKQCRAVQQPFSSAQTARPRVAAVRCQAQQNTQQLQQVAAAVVAASVGLCVPSAAHAATEVIQPGMDVATAVGSGAAVAGLGALLVATDPQKRWVRGCVRRSASVPTTHTHNAAV